MNFESKWFKKNFDDITFVKVTSKCVLLFTQGFRFRQELFTISPAYFDAIIFTFLSLFLGGIEYLGKAWAKETQNNHTQ